MKKLISIVIVVAVIAYFGNAYLEKEAKKEIELAEAKRAEEILRTKTTQITETYNAVDNWAASLSKGSSYRLEPILTIELEKLWLQGRPILFVGSFQDIATHNNNRYTVTLERNLLGSFEYMFGTELQISVLANKGLVDSFLSKHPNIFKSFGFDNNVAVVANISSIRTAYVQGDDGVRNEIRIGEGELLDIVYAGRNRF